MAAQADEQPENLLATEDGAPPGGAVAAAVAVDDHIGGEQLDQAVHVAVLDRVEELAGQPVPLLP